MASDPEKEVDLEASKPKELDGNVKSSFSSTGHEHAQGSADEVARARELQRTLNVLRQMRRGEEWLDDKLGVETRGIDRIPEEEKRPPSLFNIFWLWWSLNVHVGVIPLGILGPEFGLSLNQSVAAAFVGTVVGSLCTAFTGTLGPKTGLRMVAVSRYSFGFWGAKLCSVLNVIIGCGFAGTSYT